MEWVHQNRRTTTFLSVAALTALVVVGLTQLDRLILMLEWVQGAGAVGWLVFATLYLLGTLMMLPASLLQGSAGFLLGPFGGFLAAWAGSVGCGAVSFLLARTVLRDVVARRVGKHPQFEAIDAAVGEGGVYLAGLLRLSPISPFNIFNYALGLTPMPFRDFVLGTAIGCLPAVILYSYIGSTVHSLTALVQGQTSAHPGPQLVVLVTTVVASILVARFAQQALRKALRQTST